MTVQWRTHAGRMYSSAKTAEGTGLLLLVFRAGETWQWRLTAGQGLVAVVTHSGTADDEQSAKAACTAALNHTLSEETDGFN